MNKKILVIAAHPDDEVLGCGGTMAKAAREGQEVHIAILGEGITSRHNKREDADPQSLKNLQKDIHRAAEILNVSAVHIHSLPDNQFDSVPLLNVVKIVESLIEDLQPTIVYTQHGGDLNIDHAITFRATLTALRPHMGCVTRQLLAYEVASSTEWSFQQFAPVFRPNVFHDISEFLEQKIEAMQAYESESRKFPHPRAPESLRASAQRWGSASGCSAAEAFQLIWSAS